MTNLKGYFVPKQHWALMGKFAWWLVSSVYCIQMCLLITGCRRQFYKIFHWSNKLELRLLCPGSPHRQLREDIPAGRSKLESKWTMKKKKKVTWCGLGQSRAGKIFPNCEIFSILLSFSPLRRRCFITETVLTHNRNRHKSSDGLLINDHKPVPDIFSSNVFFLSNLSVIWGGKVEKVDDPELYC